MSTHTIIGYGDGISTDEGVRDEKSWVGVFDVDGGFTGA